MPFWSAPPLWRGETAFILAAGPSVREVDLSRLHGRRVIAVKSMWEKYKQADALFFADHWWWHGRVNGGEWQECGERTTQAFGGLIVTTANLSHPRLRIMRKAEPTAFAAAPDTLALKATSTTGAINLAMHFGASKIVLLGVDAAIGNDGVRHAHGKRWPNPIRPNAFDRQVAEFRTIAPSAARRGVEIVNVNPASAVDAFRHANFEDCL